MKTGTTNGAVWRNLKRCF